MSAADDIVEIRTCKKNLSRILINVDLHKFYSYIERKQIEDAFVLLNEIQYRVERKCPDHS